MITLSVNAMDGESAYGKEVSDLQENIVINEDSISGTLKHVEQYTQFSGVESEQSGNFLALKIEIPEKATCTTELLNGEKGQPVDLTTDKYCVYRITNKNTQKIKFTVDKNGEQLIKQYDLSGLTLTGVD